MADRLTKRGSEGVMGRLPRFACNDRRRGENEKNRRAIADTNTLKG